MMQILNQSCPTGVTKHMQSVFAQTYEDVAAITVCMCQSSMHQKAIEILQNRLSV